MVVSITTDGVYDVICGLPVSVYCRKDAIWNSRNTGRWELCKFRKEFCKFCKVIVNTLQRVLCNKRTLLSAVCISGCTVIKILWFSNGKELHL